jgi:hypothetical protein
MTEAKDIHTLIKEAKLYQEQGLLTEARKRYESAVEMVETDGSIQDREKILEDIFIHIQELDAVTYRVEKKTHITEISPRTKTSSNGCSLPRQLTTQMLRSWRAPSLWPNSANSTGPFPSLRTCWKTPPFGSLPPSIFCGATWPFGHSMIRCFSSRNG